MSCQNTNKDIITSNHLTNKDVLIPELFLPDIVTNLKDQEFGLTLSPDCKTILFTRRIGDEKQKVYETRFANNIWSTPVITSFSTDRDESPQFSKDGNTVYFGSARPIPNRPNKGNFDMNVWQTQWVDGKWTTPIPLPEIINKVQVENEEWPSSNVSHFVTANDTTFYTGTMNRNDKGLDIYETSIVNGEFSNFKKLPKTINKEDKWEYAPVISADGQYLFFQVYNREDGFGGDDIFISKKDKNNQWLPSVNLGKLINTNMNECPAAISSDGKYFFFSRDYKKNPEEYDGISSLYFVETRALNLDNLFK
ncbi:hypothetical protein [Olleya sp. YS]|uniref:hypothetical protein n=1 Tax=Olleya sp. YS TaxID=3028318 RepID=UPI0024345248|nr:hypothetical protein [Olleya sp. YS]WGD34554.1 hypothetical protein Ollyesu_12285 [Olleya sp. YS]